ncbi:MAG: hypothetical protein D4R44_05985 [Actinobacteria bacterium]|nr:MAG: hypothetical protein D4R44_05985 [Actinomycetota bacterium]
MGFDSRATRRPNSWAIVVSMFVAVVRSSCCTSQDSASRQRMIVGPTAPRAIRTELPFLSTARHAEAIEITMALRTPTFA